MKKKSLLLVVFLLVVSVVFTIKLKDENTIVSNEELREIHKKNLKKSPFKEVHNLSKPERKAIGLPPNKFYEQEWELTMNPELGRPTPENLKEIREDLSRQRGFDLAAGRVPGDASDNNWIERGPNNVGGRVRALMFDPNDTTDETVFAGGVSGGLWKNTNISNPASVWTRVDIPENLAVSSIAADPNDSNIFYVGTGESYVGGDVNGDGLWQSTDGGATWTNIFGGISGPTTFESASNITVNTPAGIAADYLSFPTVAFGTEITSVITADFILANDPAPTGTQTPENACNSFGPDASGKIAVIRRGSCNFDDKVKNAENAGALGVIMMNNIDGTPIPMGGDDTTITIPSVMISKEDGDLIEAAMATGTVNGSLNPSTGSFTGNLVPGIQHINDIQIRNNGGVSEVYVAAGDSFYGSANATTFLGGPEFGLYKSVDNGANWVEVVLPLTANGNKHCPNDIEIGSDNKIWLSTTNSTVFGDGGGIVFSSTDGNTFTQQYTVSDGNRTQIAVSKTTPDKVYVLAELIEGTVFMVKTTSGFASASTIFDLPLPNDADPGIPAGDFTRGQAFYDLMIDVDPLNDDVVYTGGIDLFKSTIGGDSWGQFSHWYGGFGEQEVHADQHTMAFGNNDTNKVLFGNDGGVYYSANAGTTTGSRNNGFNTSQFYTVGVGPTTAFTGDYFAGGLQDNGTQLFANANPNATDSTTEPYGGDGAYTFFDQDGTDRYFIRNYVYNQGIELFNFDGPNLTINSEPSTDTNGAFICPQALDSNLDILYTDYSSGANMIVRRYSGIKSQATIERTPLQDPELDSRPTAFTVSTHTTTSSTLYVGTILGDIFKVTNAESDNPTWTELDLGNVIVGSISDIEIGQTENDIFLTIHNYGVQSIWYTPDGGATWLAKEGNLPDMPVKTVLQNPLNLNEVIVGTELGVWFTSDFSSAAPTWNSAFNGMSNVKVLDLDMRDDNMVFAATYGRGVFSGLFSLDANGDEDGDGVLNGVDNCVNNANPGQEDADGNGVGDACQDTDMDSVLDVNDNCPTMANMDQADTDGNGIGDVCQDSDGDNIMDDVDNCTAIANPDQEDTNGNGQGDACDTSYEAPTNITLEIVSETCEGQNNGKINITTVETYVTYTATLVGGGLNLSQAVDGSYSFENLTVGSYTVCVSVDGRDYEQCFEINIDAAAVIELEIVNNPGDNSNLTSVNVSRGTAPYTVTFNDEVIKITSNPIFDLELVGSGELEIKTSKACEGTYKKTIVNQFNIIASPNPVINNLKIALPTSITQNQIELEVYDVNGRLISNKNYTRYNSSYIEVPFSNLNAGVYFIKLNLETSKVLRIIKK